MEYPRCLTFQLDQGGMSAPARRPAACLDSASVGRSADAQAWCRAPRRRQPCFVAPPTYAGDTRSGPCGWRLGIRARQALFGHGFCIYGGGGAGRRDGWGRWLRASTSNSALIASSSAAEPGGVGAAGFVVTGSTSTGRPIRELAHRDVTASGHPLPKSGAIHRSPTRLSTRISIAVK